MKVLLLATTAVILAGCGRTDAPTAAIPRLPVTDVLPAADPIIVAAGDIACGAQTTGKLCVHAQTAALAAASNPTAVLVLGDNQYENGSLAEYTKYYAPTWGTLKAITYPVIGNHEYHTSGASGYFDYFNGVGTQTGRAGTRGKGYYSTNIGTWHIVVLNDNCATVTGGCAAGSPQEQWLRADLASNPAACTLAALHIPRFSSGMHGSKTASTALWKALYDYGADVVLVGHDHNYERFAPQTHQGQRDDAFGIREFVVGTGGEELETRGITAANSEIFDNTSMGVLRMTLSPNGYGWRFLAIPGHTQADTGSALCHGVPTGPPPLAAPVADYTVSCQSSVAPASCTLNAAPSTDDGGFSNLTFAWTNTVGRPTKTGAVATYKLSTTRPNVFDVTLTATDADGLSHAKTKTVSIPVAGANQPPVPAFTVSCTSASCVLDASGSSDDGGLSNLTFTWTNDAGRPLKTGTVVKYLYSVTYPNTFNVTLTAKDAAGMTALVTRPVAIR